MADHPFAASLSKEIEHRRSPEYLLAAHRAVVKRADEAGISTKEIANHARASFPELKSVDVAKIEVAVRAILGKDVAEKKTVKAPAASAVAPAAPAAQAPPAAPAKP